MSEVSNTSDPPPEVVEEFERQLDEWCAKFRKALAERFAGEREAED